MVLLSNMKAQESKIKIYCLGNILILSEPYLSNMINDHRTINEWKI